MAPLATAAGLPRAQLEGMNAGLYSAASALDAYRVREEAIAQNLANVDTTGFKRQVVAFRPFEQALAAAAGPSGTVTTEIGTDWSAGEPIATGAPLDLALDGRGFFAVGTADGVRYTRAGSFAKSAAGLLTTPDGDPVLGTSGPIQLGNASLSDVRIDERGQITTPGGSAAQLRIAAFDTDPPPLLPEGRGLFRPNDGAQETPSSARVRQGFRERSNTEPVGELLSLIEVHRSFEASTKTIDSVIRTLDKTTELR